MNENEIYSVIEGMLFVSNEPISIKGISEALGMTALEMAPIMERLMQSYIDDDKRGIKIVQTEDKFTIVTKQNIFKYLTKVYQGLEKPRITPSMLETLAIIAYKQPVTRLEVENIRGVNSDHVVGKLLEYELICEVGRAEKIGRPILFGTTDKFLVYFGLRSIDELPKVESGTGKENLEEIIDDKDKQEGQDTSSIKNDEVCENITEDVKVEDELATDENIIKEDVEGTNGEDEE